jgi:hypothetical protein
LGYQLQQLTRQHQALRKFILTQLLRELGCTKAQVGQKLAAQHPAPLESLGWLHRGPVLTATFHLVGFFATATRFHGQRMRICLRSLAQIMALVTGQQRSTFPTTMTIGSLALRLLFQPHQTTTGSLGVGELLLGFSFTIHLATPLTAPTCLTQQA